MAEDNINLDFSSDKPLVRQIQDVTRQRIVAGSLQPGQRLPTMRALSKELGVSLGTVKQAINTLVAEGYLNARKGSGVYVIGPQTQRQDVVLVLPSARLEQMSRIIDGVGAGLVGTPYHLIVQAANMDFDEQMHLLQYLDKPFVAGVILYTPGLRCYSDSLQQLVNNGTICVQTVRYLQDVPTDAVIADGFRMGQMAFQHLLERGHRNIGIVDTTSDERMSIDIRQGIASICRKFGASFDELPRICTSASDLNEKQPWRLGQLAAEKLLRDHSQLTALVGLNAHLALGAYYAARQAGRRIPQDISILAMENDLMVFHMTEPEITVVDLPLEVIAERAVLRLRQRLDHPETHGSPQIVQLEPRLIERGSVATLSV